MKRKSTSSLMASLLLIGVTCVNAEPPVGMSVEYKYMRPFGYINTVDLVGFGDCNNPFFGTNILLKTIAPNSASRTDFGNHAFAMFNGYVFDACAGPALGKSLVTYLTDTIDVSRTPFGNSSNVTARSVTRLK